MNSKEVAEWKTAEVDSLAQLLDKYSVITLADLFKVRAMQLQKLRKTFKSDVFIRVAKNTRIRRAIKKCRKPKIAELSNFLTGSSALLFTDLNPFKLSILLNKNKIKIVAKAGDVVKNDVVVHAGNTGLPAGPAITELREVGIPTRIEAGSVFVSEDTIVAKAGQTISPNLASVLSKLNIKPLEASLSLIAAYDKGVIIHGDELNINLDEKKNQLKRAWNNAFNLAFSAHYTTRETILPLLQKASREARELAVQAAFTSPETAPEILRRAHTQMLSLVKKLGQINEKAIPPRLGETQPLKKKS